MVKHRFVIMRRFFTSERFGRSQYLAAVLLFVFLAQSLWLVNAELQGTSGPEESEALRIREGWKQLHRYGIAANPFLKEAAPQETGADDVADDKSVKVDFSAFDRQHSPLVYLISAAPLLAWPAKSLTAEWARVWMWLPRVPFLICGLFLGASLWYVARRLCGNTGGLVALTLYCFSPSMIQASALWHTEPELIAVWGAFGTVFTAIAVAHTLYAPREVVLWNWRRIVLLGISLALAVGMQFSMIVLVPMALVFLLYVAPIRRGSGFVIWLAACAVAAILLFGTYFFHPRVFAESMHHAVFWGATWRGFAVPTVYRQIAVQVGRACPAMALALPITMVTYVIWPRTRYFGNTAPLLVAASFLILGMAHPHVAGEGFLLGAVPFLFLFVAGVVADLMETQYRHLVNACVSGMLAAYALWSLYALAHVPSG
ncbi:MAG TPA: hypothetical protein VI386_02990 [Candidatus Sulfotelmatobacter sp.]